MRDFFYCLIFPHPRNNHRAGVLHPKALVLIILFFIFSSLFFPSSINPFSSKLRALAEISVQELLTLTNEKRKENGLGALIQSPQLSTAAENKADDMFAKNYWAHNSPTGTTPWVFIKQSGYNYVYAGENLARGFNSSTDVVNAWMASKAGHRENILSSDFKDVGFAVKSGKLNGEETFLVVQELGSKSVLPIAKKTTSKKNLGTRKVLGFNFSPLISKPSFSISSEIVIFLMLGFILILFVDMIFIQRKKIVRFVGHNLDHALFLLVIIFVIAAFNMGEII